MKITLTLLLVVATVVNTATAKPVAVLRPPAAAPLSVRPPKPVCYKKQTTCCFAFAGCGVQVVSKKVAAKCPVRTCANKCFNVCKPKSVGGTQHKCYKTLAFKKRCYKHLWLPLICIKVPVRTKKCADYMVKSVTMPCHKVCKSVCSVAVKPCVYYRVFHYPKFCPKLTCGKEKVLGSAAKPKVFVSSAGTFIKKSHTPLGVRK